MKVQSSYPVTRSISLKQIRNDLSREDKSQKKISQNKHLKIYQSLSKLSPATAI